MLRPLRAYPGLSNVGKAGASEPQAFDRATADATICYSYASQVDAISTDAATADSLLGVSAIEQIFVIMCAGAQGFVYHTQGSVGSESDGPEEVVRVDGFGLGSPGNRVKGLESVDALALEEAELTVIYGLPSVGPVAFRVSIHWIVAHSDNTQIVKPVAEVVEVDTLDAFVAVSKATGNITFSMPNVVMNLKAAAGGIAFVTSCRDGFHLRF